MTLDSSDRIARLSADKRAQLEERLRGRKPRPGAQATKIPLRPQRNVAPLSFAQQRLWFLEHWDPGTAVYNVCVPLRLHGPLDIAALERALNRVVARHEVLRSYLLSSFRGEPNQVILPELTVALPVVPLTLDERGLDGFLRDLIASEAKQPIRLDQAPLFRARVYQLGAQDHILFFLIHHIIYDSWSLGVFLKEWFHYYHAERAGRDAPLPALPFQFGDFAAWQLSEINNELHRKQAAYWMERLADRETVTELMPDHPRPLHLTYTGKLHRLSIPLELKRAMNDLARAEATTFYVATLAAFSVVLHHVAGANDLIVGTPVAHRPHTETEPLIGYFVNTLPVRVRPTRELTFRALLHQLQDTMLSALNNLSLPFERVIDELGLERDTSRSPLFQTFFATQKRAMPPVDTGELSFEACHLDNGTAMFELSVFLYEEGVDDVLQFNSDLFDDATIARIAERFVRALEQAVRAPDTQLAAFALVADAEQAQLQQWARGPRLDVAPACIHQRFAAQVARTPDAPAVVCAGEVLSYRELDARANQLASYLRARGAGPEVRIAVCVERSPSLLVSLLGILKAGAAYVPVDHEYPRERIALMLDDAEVALLVTESHLVEVLPVHGTPVVLIDRDRDAIAREPAGPVASGVAPDHVAYVIYTSGSTGRPKGVEVTHDNVNAFLSAMQHEPGLAADDKLVAITSISFDIAGLELYLPLVTGATVVLASRAQVTDSFQLAQLIDDSGATVMQATPATWRMLLDAGWANPRQIRMLVGGEALPKDLAKALLATGAPLWNLYGPTEVTIWATVANIALDDDTITIGRPIANYDAFVLDASLRPVAIGGVGDLYLGGRGVARGYLHAEQLTAERFVASPFGRIYKTGDRARLRNDGRLEFLGRTDHQVKLHGFRIELEDIEVALRSHPAARGAAVALREDHPGDKRLVGYVVPDPGYRADDTDAEVAQAEHVSGWLALYDQVYEDAALEAAGVLNTIGWNSSYTGELIAAADMQEQVDQTVDRVRARRPRRVLELGCGAGLHVPRIAPETEYYLATDGSATALAALRRELVRAPLRQVEVQQRKAHDIAGLHGFDCVLINSVVQYFPDVHYLMQVLTRAVDVVAASGGGIVVVADVRNFRLLEAYHTSVELFKAADDLACDQLRANIRGQLRKENELLVAPGLFAALRDQLPAVGGVELELRRGHARNELTRFRYDAVIHVGRGVRDEAGPRWSWPAEQLTLAALRTRLAERREPVVVIDRVPNARLTTELAAMAILAGDAPATVGALRERLAQVAPGIEPEALWSLGGELGYHVELTWPAPDEGGDGTLRAILRREPARIEARPARTAAEPRPPAFWQTFATDLTLRRFGEVVPRLRRHLQDRLPPYMVPSTFVALDALPLTPNGKLDRARLPAPEALNPELRKRYVEPRTDDERRFAKIWADTLRLERVGRDDDYFELGGDSVRSILLISRAKEAGFELTSKQLFELRTIAGLLAVIGGGAPEAQAPAAPAVPARPLPALADVAGAVHQMVAPDNVEAVYPTTSYQRWAIRLFERLGDPGLYNTQPWYRIRHEQFQPQLFAEAWQRTVAMHHALRAGFVWRGLGLASPIQVVARDVLAEVNHVDLRHLAYAEQQAAIEAFLTADFARGFVAAEPSHIRIGLVRVDDDDYLFVYALDHLLQDGWSMSMFLRDALQHYAALRDGRAVELPRPPMPYGDVLTWAWQQDRGDAHAFWRAMLAGFSRPNQLVDHDAPLTVGNAVLCKEVFLSATLSSELYELCKRFQVTFPNFLAGVWSIMMSAETGDDDVVFGLTVSGRPAHMEGIELTVGNMVNLLPLRLRVTPAQTFYQWMKEVQPVLWEMKNYEYADALTIWDDSELAGAALPFQSYITYQAQPLDQYTLAVGQHWAQGTMKPARTGVPLKLEVLPTAQVALRLQYYQDCFDAETIPRIGDSLAYLLQLIQEAPLRTLGEMKQLLARKFPRPGRAP